MVGVTLRLRKSPLKSKSSANENRDRLSRCSAKTDIQAISVYYLVKYCLSWTSTTITDT